MATVIQQASASNSLGGGVTRYFLLHGNYMTQLQGTESTAASTWRSAGTLSNLYINILTNDRAASSLRTRKGTADGNQVISITGLTTGKFEDVSNTDAVTAGDDWHAKLVTGAGGTVFTWRIQSILFAATTNTVQRIGAEDINIDAASTTTFSPFYGLNTRETPDSEVGMTMRTAGTFRNFVAYIVANSRTTTTTFRSRVNSANGNQTFDVAGSTTGTFEDTTNSDIIVSGDLVNYSHTTGTGTGNCEPEWVAIEFETTNGNQQYVAGEGPGVVQLANVTTYYPFAGRLNTSTTESDVIAETNLAFTSSLLQCNISANTVTAASTLTLRINSGAGANQTVSITASTTGIFQDTTNTDSIVATDTLDYLVVTGATGTSLTIRSITMLGDSTVASGISLNSIERKMPRGVLRGVARGTI